MVIAPGSVRADGKPYLFVNGHDLSTLAPLPGSILAKLKRSPGQQRLDTGRHEIEATPEGDRHKVVRDACWSLAHDVVAGKLDETEFRRRIADMASTCRPPMDKLDVENSIESALRKVRAETGKKDKPDAAPAFKLPDFEPADEPTPIADMLDGIVKTLLDYVVMDEYQAKTAALWICIATRSRRPTIPRGCGSPSPMRRCGKSTLLRRAVESGAAAAAAQRRFGCAAVSLDRRPAADDHARRGRQCRAERQSRSQDRAQRRHLARRRDRPARSATAMSRNSFRSSRRSSSPGSVTRCRDRCSTDPSR